MRIVIPGHARLIPTNCNGPEQRFEVSVSQIEASDVGRPINHFNGFRQPHQVISKQDVGGFVTRVTQGDGYVCHSLSSNTDFLPGRAVGVEPRPLIAECAFVPQAWQGDVAIPVDPLGDTRFEVFLSGSVPAAHSLDADALRDLPGVPEWIRTWAGPFEVEIENREVLEILVRGWPSQETASRPLSMKP